MKFCGKCGNTLDDDAIKCELCGEIQIFGIHSDSSEKIDAKNDKPANIDYSVYNEPQNLNYTQSQQYENYAVTNSHSQADYGRTYNSMGYNSSVYKKFNVNCMVGFILGLVSVFIPFVSVITSVIGLILSILGVKNFNEQYETNKGLGIAGIVINSVIILFMILFVMFFLILMCNFEYFNY